MTLSLFIDHWRPRLPALLAAFVLPAAAHAVDSTTVFNEILYHPAAAGGAEWIELHNQMAVDMDLSAWRLTGGVDYTFPDGTTIRGGGYLVVSSTPGAIPGALGPWSGSLANSGETIRLKNVSGRVMDELSYRDSGRWPVGADGSGATLAKRVEGGSGAAPEAWSASPQIGGTPGARNFPDIPDPAGPGVVINEITGSGDPVFRVELKNEGTLPADVGGMKLGSATLAAAVLPPGGFLVLEESQLSVHPASGDRLFLLSADSTTLVDAAIVRDTPQARLGGRMLVPSAPTFGAENAFTLREDIVINEIMYHFPPDPSAPASPGATETVVVLPLDAVWRYNAANSDPGTAWAQTAHPVGGDWQSGAGLLGFETLPDTLPDTLRTPFASSNAPTYYFETDFTLTAAQLAGLAELQLEHVIDDGALFYLNGVEISAARTGMPDGAVTFDTLATANTGNAALSAPVTLPVAGLTLHEGTNRLSVEVHQLNAGSNDMICGARLTALVTTSPAVPALPIRNNPEEWVELHNKSAAPVDLSGWKLDGEVGFTFPAGAMLAAGDYLVVARNAAALKVKWPEIAGKIHGDWSGSLSNSGGRIQLEDSTGNPADEVDYLPGGWADGGGSSLELTDPRSENRTSPAWRDSDETGKSEWTTFSYRMNGSQRFGPTTWNEIRLGMLDAGECLIDDLTVRKDPDGAGTQLIQNGDFEALPAGSKWRLLGNHRGSAVIEDPENAANHVLKLAASGPAETNHNHAESTFLPNQALASASSYEISFRSRWLAGTNQLNVRGYYQKIARTTELPIPSRLGTPGAVNSRRVANAGPVLSGLTHSPAIPAANAPVTVSFAAADPDGVASATLRYRVNGATTFTAADMTLHNGRWSAQIPGQAAGVIVQFYAEAVDGAGAGTFGPALGSDSRALVQWQDSQNSSLAAHQLRLIMLTTDRTFLLSTLNRLSNERIPGTVVYRGSEIFYDTGVRLQGTAAGRVRDGENYVGYDIAFPPDHLFRGVQESVGIDRSARTPAVKRQDEFYVLQTFHRAGIPCHIDDLCYFIAPQTIHTGTAILQMAGYSGLWTDSQFESSGTVYNYDVTYDPTTSSGGVEGLKPPVPFVHVTTDLTDLGDDKEQYRGPFDIRAGKRKDDYRGLMTLCKTMGLPTTQLAEAAPQVLDLDEVLRCTALVNLWGIDDTYYTGGFPHNIRLFVPEDGTGVKFLPWDMDFVMSRSSSTPIIATGNNLGRLISSVPAARRLYLGHVRHLCATAFNSTYLTPWLTHYGSVVGQSFSSAASYINARRTSVTSQYPAQASYAITTNGGADFSVGTREVELQGTGWIDIHEIRRAGSADPLAITWPAVTTWRATLPLAPGENVIALDAYDFDGGLISTKTITVTSTLTDPAPRDFLRVTELHYHPANPATAAELAATSVDSDLEFIELKNTGAAPLNLDGVHFGAGLSLAIPDGTTLAAGEFAVVVRNRSAFTARYGAGIRILGEFPTDSLANSGETLTVLDATGAAIQSFTWTDNWFPSTDGPGWSMVVRDENATAPDLNRAAAWGISVQKHGNPGASNGPVFATEFEGWRHQQFPEADLDDPAISGPDAAPGGLSNFLRYALGLTISQPAAAGRSVALSGPDQIDFSWNRPRNALDLTYLPQSSPDLITWSADAGPPFVRDNGDGTETVTVRFTGGAPRFVRLRVTAP